MAKTKFLLLACIAVLSMAGAQPVQQVLPSKAQLDWADAEVGVLIHFDMPVFEPEYDFRKDWSYHPDLSIFNPKQLDTDQWIRTSKAAGATYAVLVAKHGSGFSYGQPKHIPTALKILPGKMARATL